jgi:hypothetical protein
MSINFRHFDPKAYSQPSESQSKSESAPLQQQQQQAPTPSVVSEVHPPSPKVVKRRHPEPEEEEEDEEEYEEEVEIRKPRVIVKVVKVATCNFTHIFLGVLLILIVLLAGAVGASMFFQGQPLNIALKRVIMGEEILSLPCRPPTAYPIYYTTHDTKSSELELKSDPIAQPLLASLEETFKYHFQRTSMYECLCMHHLHMPAGVQNKRVCAVKTAGPVLMLVNPRIVGESSTKTKYKARSVSCPAPMETQLESASGYVMQWDALDGTYTAQFANYQAACLKLALLEFEGSEHCN